MEMVLLCFNRNPWWARKSHTLYFYDSYTHHSHVYNASETMEQFNSHQFSLLIFLTLDLCLREKYVIIMNAIPIYEESIEP